MARIVVADDEADIRRLVAFTLKRRGHDVLEADSGDGALALIRETMPDAVVLDVMMPGMTGLEVARILSSEPATSSIPIIILSAKGQATEVDQGLASGATAYLVKPFAPQELAAKISELLVQSQP